MDDEEQEVLRSFLVLFRQGTDHDLWGQPVEAVTYYNQLSRKLSDYATREDGRLFTDEQKKVAGKVVTCIDLRSSFLQKSGHPQTISLEDLNKIKPIIEEGLECEEFPIDVSSAQIWAHTMSSIAQVQNDAPSLDGTALEEEDMLKAHGSLLPKPLPIGGKQVLTIHIIKLGVKDASQYLDPIISISVKDKQGVDLTAQQDTPVSTCKEDQYVVFNRSVHIQKPIDILPPGYAIFFEFKHYKPRKNCLSTKCWSFLEKDEIKDGESALELYKKPTDVKRRSLRLLTVKPLYLHLKLIINT